MLLDSSIEYSIWCILNDPFEKYHVISWGPQKLYRSRRKTGIWVKKLHCPSKNALQSCNIVFESKGGGGIGLTYQKKKNLDQKKKDSNSQNSENPNPWGVGGGLIFNFNFTVHFLIFNYCDKKWSPPPLAPSDVAYLLWMDWPNLRAVINPYIFLRGDGLQKVKGRIDRDGFIWERIDW